VGFSHQIDNEDSSDHGINAFGSGEDSSLHDAAADFDDNIDDDNQNSNSH